MPISSAQSTTLDCGCAGTSGSLVSLERTRFFPRQLVDADDLTQDQLYLREKLRRHNRLLHGWGIVCGALVTAGTGTTVTISPGMVLGPYGDEIVIDPEITFDLSTGATDGSLDCASSDPWCADVPVIKDDTPAYLSIKYAECPTRPVSVPGCACGCEADCEYSRTRDGYQLTVLADPPASYSTDPWQWPATFECLGGNQARACLPCPTDPWVILADVTVAGGAVTKIDMTTHRRYVASFAGYAFRCSA